MYSNVIVYVNNVVGKSDKLTIAKSWELRF